MLAATVTHDNCRSISLCSRCLLFVVGLLWARVLGASILIHRLSSHSLGIDDSTTRLVLLCLLAVVFFLYVTNRRASRPNFDNFSIGIDSYALTLIFVDGVELGALQMGWLPLHRQASSWCCVMSWLCI